MIQRYVIRYGLAIASALAAALPFAFSAFTGERAASTVSMWMTFFALEWLLFEPSLHGGESLHEARSRVRSAILRDPVFWTFAAGTLFAALRWINAGLGLVYDPETSRWAVSAPLVAWFPSAVGESGRTSFAVASALTVVSAALRHGMGRSARSMFLLVAAAIAGLGGLCVSIAACCAVPALVAAADGGLWQAVFPGEPWTIWLVAGVCALATVEERGWRKAGHPVAFLAIAGCAAGAIFFCPAPIAALWIAAAAIAVVFSLVYTGSNLSLTASFRTFAVFGLGIVAAITLFSAAAPEKTISGKIAGLEPSVTLPAEYERMEKALVANAMRVWNDRPWLGAGTGAYALRAPFFAGRDDWDDLPVKPSFVPNAFVQALAERGITGCLLALAGLFTLFGTGLARIIALWRRHAEEGADLPPFHLSYPIIGWSPILLVPVLVFECLNVSSPVVSPGEWTAVGCALSAAVAAFPPGKRETKRVKQAE